MLKDEGIKYRSPLIVELVGLAGAGKTSLAKSLYQHDGKFRVDSDLKLRKKEHLLLCAGTVPYLLPFFTRRTQKDRPFTWEELKTIIYLKAWPRVLTRQTSSHGTITLLDQGPVFKLATLNAFGPERLKSQVFEQWWHNLFLQWAKTLNIVIWLNAPFKVLIERINTRDKRHVIKGKSEQDAYKFLVQYQTSYEQIFAKLATYGGPTILPFDTSQICIEQIMDEILVSVT